MTIKKALPIHWFWSLCCWMFFLPVNQLFSQTPTVLGTQVINGTYNTYNLAVIGNFRQARLLATSNAGANERNWEFATGTAGAPNYSNNWRPTLANQLLGSYNQFVPPAIGTASAWYNTGSGGSSGFLPAVVGGYYYTFNIRGDNAAPNNMAVLETNYNPETITTVTRTPNNVGAATGTTINIVTAAAPQSNVFVRYATNVGFTGSTIVQAGFTGVNGTATLPAFAAGTTVYYYVYNSPVSKAVIDADAATFGEGVHDMYTLNLNNNAGANYSYTVLPISVTATNTVNDGGYATLGAAFTAINTGVHTGVINIQVAGNTTETASAILNAGAYTAINIQPFGDVARTISGNINSAALVHFNGADNVIVDGLNVNGNTLTFSNTSTANTNGTATLRFSNGSTNNVLQNCIIEGATTSVNDGTISIGTGTNTNISIGNNTITQAGANLPLTAIYSNGAANTSITVSNNFIQNYYNVNSNSFGINANMGSNNWQITGNRFFQSSTRTASGGATHTAISVTAGGGHTINDNIIGYANSNGTGTTTYNGGFGNRFVGIELNGNSTLSSIQNNIIAGISITTSSAASTANGIFSGIYVSAGNVNIGTLSKNIIGIPTTGPISFTIANTGGTIYGINAAVNSGTAFTINCSNNTVAAFSTTSSPPASAHSFYAIQMSYGTTTSNTVLNCHSNTIGPGISIANSNTSNSSNAAGILVTGSNTNGTAVVGSLNTPNTINGVALNTAAVGATTCAGILLAHNGGTATVAGNNISNISSTGINSDGIRLTGTSGSTTAATISNNTINGISSTGNFSTISGIYLAASNGGTLISKNKVYDLSGNSTNAVVQGLAIGNGGSNTTPLTLVNNIVGDLRTPNANNNTISVVRGISINTIAAVAINVYYNTVYLSGTSTGTNFSAATIFSRTEPTLTLRNNAFVNLITPQGTGRTIAFERNAINLGTYANASNNNLYYTGTPSATNLIFFDGTNSDQTLANFQTRVAAPRDVASVTELPPFLSTVGSNSEYLHIDAAIVNLLANGATNITGITDDFDGDTRQGNSGYNGTGTAPDIGADEFEPCSDANFRWAGTVSTDWHTPANWCTGSSIPSATSNVVIPSGTPFSPNIANADAVALTITLNNGSLLTLSNTRNLTISNNGDFTNNGGTFTASGTGAVIFAGTGAIAGSATTSLQNVILNGTTTLLTTPTITGNLQLNSGSSVTGTASYGSSSTLIYNTGATTTAGTEWATGIATGAGVPQNVQIGNGANTTLNFGNTTTYRQLLGNLIIATGSNNLTLSASAGGDLRIGGNWVNNIGVAGFTGNSRLVTFNGITNAAIGGTGATTFAQLAVNKGSSISTILEVNVAVTIAPTAISTAVSNGLLRINAGGSINKTAAAGWSIANTAGLEINGGSFSQTGASVNLAGLWRMISGTATIGNLAGAHSLIYSNGSTITVSGGTLNIDARLCPLTAGVSTVTYNQSGGSVNVLRLASTSTVFAAFDIGATGSSFTWSGGSIILDKACSFTSDYFMNAATSTITSGVLQIGNTNTPAAQTIRIRSVAPVFNLAVNNSSGNNPVAQLVTNNLTVSNIFALAAGTKIDMNGRSLTLSGAINNAGSFSGNPISNLTINGTGSISNPLVFDAGMEQLGTITINRNAVPVTVSTQLTLNENGSNIASGSTLNNSSGTTLAIGSGSIAGISINGTLNIAGTLQLNSGGFVNGGVGLTGPVYANNSFLIYNNTGSFIRNVEWGSNTAGAAGYPHHVTIQNGTTVNFTNTTTFDVGCAGNLTIGHPTAVNDGALSLSDMGIHDLYVSGNINIGGTNGAGVFTMSNTIGGDLYLTGNWTRTNNGTVNFGSGNGRAVFFSGNSNSTITAHNGQLFPFAYVDKSNIANTVTLADHISISDEIGFTRGTIDLGTNNKFITILSTASKTGRVGVSSAANTAFVYGSSDITGQFIVQRYVPAKRSWRLVTAPIIAAGTHSISEAWQERGSPLTGLNYSTPAATSASILADSITADFATHITGGVAAQGFDQSPLNNSSIRAYTAGTWNAQSNINSTNVHSREGWMLFMRGDRKTFGQITNQFKPAVPTTLRPRGRIFIGTKTINGTGLTVVGNPYASALDYHTAIKTGTLAGTDQYTMWDPNLGGTFGTGSFVTLSWDADSSYYLRSAPLTGVGVSSIDNRYIPSGAAVMVDFGVGPASLTFNESDKNAANTTAAFRPVSVLQTGLYGLQEDGSAFPIDGTLQVIRNNENNDFTMKDVRKINNFAENIGVLLQHQLLSIERRSSITATDTFFYQLTQLRQRQYHLKFVFTEVPVPQGLGPYAQDLYLNKQYPLSLQDTSNVDFAVNADAASARADRFRLVWKTPVAFVALQANLNNTAQVVLSWQVTNAIDVEKYLIEQSTDGIQFINIGEVPAHTQQQFTFLAASPSAGKYYYRVIAVSSKGIQVNSNIVQLTIPVNKAGWYVYPNPASNSGLHLYLTRQPAGLYEARLLHLNGQLITQQRIVHAGGSSTHTIKPSQTLSAGSYRLELTAPNKQKSIITVMVAENK
jgi:hypothetical protein